MAFSSLDETEFKHVDKRVSQPNTYSAYQLLITTNIITTTKDES